MSDQGFPGQGLDQTQGGATGPPSPQPDVAKQLEELKAENAKLRDERRTERAKSLGTEHGLTPTETTLLTRLNADEMEATAKLLAEERKAQAAPAATPPEATAPPTEVTPPAMSPAEPPDPASLAAMSTGGTASPDGGALPAVNSSDAMLREINGATSFDQIQEIQTRYKRLQTEAEE